MQLHNASRRETKKQIVRAAIREHWDNGQQNVRIIAELLNLSVACVYTHLKDMGLWKQRLIKRKRASPHGLSDEQLDTLFALLPASPTVFQVRRRAVELWDKDLWDTTVKRYIQRHEAHVALRPKGRPPTVTDDHLRLSKQSAAGVGTIKQYKKKLEEITGVTISTSAAYNYRRRALLL